MLQLLAPDGTYGVPKGYEAYGKIIEGLDQDFLKLLYTDMARIRRFDIEATALQRQGQLGLWVPAPDRCGRARHNKGKMKKLSPL